ncbi:MAG: hypothetical protein PHW53_00295 [Patescibacteria group bacterium]|nr:hypothetical protein [Patescibacteria group bacterium]
MTEVLRISKRILTVGVVITTMAWSIGFAAFIMPLAAEAATLSAGDLIKASQPAVYYYAADGKRYVFPNENTYYSWYPDFSTLKEITDAELAAVSIGGNITIRPGTFLIKITTDPKVYAVTTGGVLHWVETEAVAQKLWGTNWASWVVDVPDSFFTNYSIGTSISTYVHPNGCLIKYASGASVYYIQDGQKRAIANEAAFDANMFQWRFVISPVAADVTYADGTAVTGGEAGITDLVAGVSGTGTGLAVALASDTPAGATVAQGSSSVQLIKVAVTASSDGNVILNTLTFHRLGVGTASDFTNVYLYEGSTRLTSGRSINTSSNEAQFNNLNLTITAGTTKYLTVRGDLSSTAIAADEHALELVATSKVGTTATVSGSFPIRGNTFTVGAQDAATLTVNEGSDPANVTVGSLAATISSFKLTAASADIKLNQISIAQAGTVVNSDVTNLKLYVGTELVAETATIVGDKINFILATPYLISNGTTKTLYVKADVVGKGGRSIITYLEYTTDVDATDNTYGWGAAVNIDDFDSGDSVTTNTEGGQLTIAYNGPATGTMPKAGQDQIFFQFGMTAAENTLEVRKISFTLAGINGDDYIDASTTDLFTDIKLVDTDSGEVVAGPTQLSSGSPACGEDATTCTWVVSDSFYVNAGTTKNLALKADVANNAWFNSDRQYVAKLNAFAADYVKNNATGEYLAVTQIVPNAVITGNTMTVKTSSLTVQLAATPVSDTYVKKTSDVASSGFVFTAGSQSAIKVTSVKVTGQGNVNGAGYTAAQLDDVITQLTLWDGTTQLGTAESPDATAGTATFDGLSYSIPAGETKTLVVKAILDSVATSGGTDDTFWVGIALETDISAEDADANSVTATDGDVTWSNPINNGPTIFQTVKNSGTLTIAAESNPSTDIVIAGKDAWTTFAQAKITSQYENISVDKIRLQRYSGGANSDFKYLAIQKDGVIVSSGTDVFPGSATATDITLSTPITVPADGSVTFQVVGKLNAIDAGATSGNNPKLAVEYNVTTGEWDANYTNSYNVKGTGAMSGERVYAAASAVLAGNPMVIRKTKLTFAKQALASSSLANGTIELYKTKVTADSAGDAGVAKLTFEFTKSGAFTVDTLKWFQDGTDISDLVTITDNLGNTVEGATDASGTIFISYTSGTEQSISGSGHIFTLKGTVGGAGSSESLNVTIKTGSSTIYTYHLNAAAVGTVRGPNLDATGVVGGEVAAYLVWSDKAAIPHNAQLDTLSTGDWTDEYLVKDLTENVVLTF